MQIKAISWNVNGLRAVERKNEFFPFINKYKPEFLFIQEIKGTKEVFPENLLENSDYEIFYNSAEKKGYAGTGIWVRKDFYNHGNIEIIGFEKGITKKDPDIEGRVSKLFFDYVVNQKKKRYCVMGIYFPNGGKSEQAWEDKLVFYDEFLKEINRLRKKEVECIWSGDVNCAHNEIDLARPKENEGVIGFHPRERSWMDRLVQNQWVDIWRKTNPEIVDVYSWWSMVTRSREKNIGWRIDYFFCDDSFFSGIKKIEYLEQQMGSDHCPVLVEFDL